MRILNEKWVLATCALILLHLVPADVCASQTIPHGAIEGCFDGLQLREFTDVLSLRIVRVVLILMVTGVAITSVFDRYSGPLARVYFSICLAVTIVFAALHLMAVCGLLELFGITSALM